MKVLHKTTNKIYTVLKRVSSEDLEKAFFENTSDLPYDEGHMYNVEDPDSPFLGMYTWIFESDCQTIHE